jgi:pimeloyl-ACP methyl ester carboxylesterase
MLMPMATSGSVRIVRRAAALLLAILILGLVGYTTFGVVVAADWFVHPDGNTDCRTPLDRFGWTYEAINYDIADDANLRTNLDMTDCRDQGSVAGSEVVASDGVPIAGWYIPAADGAGARVSSPVVVLVHGYGANKSEALKYAVPLHERFAVVAFDLRNGGRSGRTETTFGLRESFDLRAILDWVERTKHPSHIVVMGNSMGGATTVIEAATDPRVTAVILDSVHAQAVDPIARRLIVESGQPVSVPGVPAILAGVWLRTGLNLMDADPVKFIPALGDRPLLIIHGTDDVIDLPARSADVNLAAARAAGVPVELHMCQNGRHGTLPTDCPAEWAAWAVPFVEQVSGLAP